MAGVSGIIAAGLIWPCAALTSGKLPIILDFCGQDALLSPGCYQIEAGGVHLFSDIKGVYYDILGLPLLPLLAFLREHGFSALASGGGG